MCSKQNEDKVEIIIGKARNHPILSWIIIICIVCLAIVGVVKTFTEGYGILKEGWVDFTSEKLLSQEQVNEWARNQSEQEKGEKKMGKTNEMAKKINSKIWLTYEYFLNSLEETLNVYQKSEFANVYIQIPDLPENLFTPDASKFLGGVIFSRNASWSISFKDQQRNNNIVRVLEFNFLDGDGKTKDGRKVGDIQLYFNIAGRVIEINSSGTGEIALSGFSNKFSFEDFKEACPALIKSLLQYQLQHL